MAGKEIKEWRKQYGLTQVELSKHLGVTWSTVARWEIDYISIPPYLHLALATIARDLTIAYSVESFHVFRSKVSTCSVIKVSTIPERERRFFSPALKINLCA